MTTEARLIEARIRVAFQQASSPKLDKREVLKDIFRGRTIIQLPLHGDYAPAEVGVVVETLEE